MGPKSPQSEYSQLQQHKEDITKAAEVAVKVISDAANVASQKMTDDAHNASKVIAEAAAVSVRVLHEKNSDDHDLLIELKTGMAFVRSDIKDLSSGVTQKIAGLESCKADKKDFEALRDEVHGERENRMRSLENKVATFMITQGLLILFIGGLVAVLLAHIFKTT